MVTATREERRRAWLALLLLVPVPTLGVCGTMVFFPGPVGMAVWSASKVWILAFPLVWTRFVEREPVRLSRPKRAGLVFGLASGLVAGLAIVAAYFLILRGAVDPAPLRTMVEQNGLASPERYLAMAAYTCVVNSLLEEYVWRWFVFRRLERLLPARTAVAASALAFTLHHAVILATQFSGLLVPVGSLAVFSAALLWSFIYLRYRSLYACWASHALVDAAVFWAGWRLIQYV
jgi:CAAX protease family protein